MYVLAVGDVPYIAGIAITTLGGIAVVWIKVKNIYDEVKSPNGQSSGKTIYDVSNEYNSLKNKVSAIEFRQENIEQNQINLKHKLDDLFEQTQASHQKLIELHHNHLKDDNDNFGRFNETLLGIISELRNR